MTGPKFAAGLLLVVGSAFSQPMPPPPQHDQPGRSVSFVACPQFRDTARQCWTAEFGGKTYYIGGFAIETPPQLLHRALIEGVAYDSESSCGAIVLEPVYISPLPEIDAACDTVLPDNGALPREPSIFDLPPAALAANGAEMAPPPPLDGNVTFGMIFDFDSAHLNLFNQANLERIARTIMSSQASSVVVTGYSGSAHLSDGSSMVESLATGRLRAEAVGKALVLIGVQSNLVTLRNVEKAPVGTKVGDVSSRKVTVEIRVPAGPKNR